MSKWRTCEICGEFAGPAVLLIGLVPVDICISHRREFNMFARTTEKVLFERVCRARDLRAGTFAALQHPRVATEMEDYLAACQTLHEFEQALIDRSLVWLSQRIGEEMSKDG